MRERTHIRVWSILFSVLILHFYLFPRLLPTHDVMGKEGLKKILVQGIAMMPAMFCLAASMTVEGIRWYIQKKREKAEIRKGIVILWLALLCVNLWWCISETEGFADAVQDWNCMEEAEKDQETEHPWQRAGIDRAVLKNWTFHNNSSKGSAGSSYLQNADRTLSFSIGKDRERKIRIESAIDEELTIYYYHHSKVPLCIRAGDEVLAGEGEVKGR